MRSTLSLPLPSNGHRLTAKTFHILISIITPCIPPYNAMYTNGLASRRNQKNIVRL